MTHLERHYFYALSPKILFLFVFPQRSVVAEFITLQNTKRIRASPDHCMKNDEHATHQPWAVYGVYNKWIKNCATLVVIIWLNSWSHPKAMAISMTILLTLALQLFFFFFGFEEEIDSWILITLSTAQIYLLRYTFHKILVLGRKIHMFFFFFFFFVI